MTTLHNRPTLDDVMETNEPVTPHRRRHGKAAAQPDEDELDRKTTIERVEVDPDGADDG